MEGLLYNVLPQFSFVRTQTSIHLAVYKEEPETSFSFSHHVSHRPGPGKWGADRSRDVEAGPISLLCCPPLCMSDTKVRPNQTQAREDSMVGELQNHQTSTCICVSKCLDLGLQPKFQYKPLCTGMLKPFQHEKQEENPCLLVEDQTSEWWFEEAFLQKFEGGTSRGKTDKSSCPGGSGD